MEQGEVNRTGQSVMEFLLALALLALPFNGLPQLVPLFGGMTEGAFYVFAAGIAAWLAAALVGRRVWVPAGTVSIIMGAFLLWAVLSGLVNGSDIVAADFKGREGMEKYVNQLFVLGFGVLATLFVYNVYRARPGDFFARVRRFLLLSFLVAGAYSVVEIAFLLGSDAARGALESINVFIHGSPDMYYGRLRSVSGEASWFAMYCSVVVAWVMSYAFSSRRGVMAWVALAGYLFLLVILSFSRLMYFTIALQAVLFFLLLAGRPGVSAARLGLVVASIVGFLAVGASLAGSEALANRTLLEVFTSIASTDNSSNVIRFGSQTAALRMAAAHPLFGVGFGQYGFHMADYLPQWAWSNPEIQQYLSPYEGTPWPPVHGMYTRIAAEMGYGGLLLWLALWTAVFVDCFRRFLARSRASGEVDLPGVCVLVSIAGVVASGLNQDTFWFMGYWLVLGLALAYAHWEPPGEEAGVRP